MQDTPHHLPHRPGHHAPHRRPTNVTEPGDDVDSRARLDAALDSCMESGACGAPAVAADPGVAAHTTAEAYVRRARDAGVLPADAAAELVDPLADRLRSADTPAEARQRAERAIGWAAAAARRHAWRPGDAPDEGRPA